MAKSTSHTSQLIKENIATITNLWPKHFIRPMNSFENPIKPKDMEEDVWDSIPMQEKTNKFSPEPNHRRYNHYHAHICVTEIYSKNEYGFKKYGLEQYYYVTSSTFFTSSFEKLIMFRKNLIEDWLETGFANILWFQKDSAMYADISSKDIDKYFRIARRKKTLIETCINGYGYYAFPIPESEMRYKFNTVNEKSVFKAQYVSTFDYIEPTTYRHSTKCYNGTLYVSIRDINGEFHRISYKSISEAYRNLEKVAYSQKTFYRNILRNKAQVSENKEIVYLVSYDEKKLDEFEADIYKFVSKGKFYIRISGKLIPVAQQFNAEEDGQMNELAEEIVNKILSKDTQEESLDDYVSTSIIKYDDERMPETAKKIANREFVGSLGSIRSEMKMPNLSHESYNAYNKRIVKEKVDDAIILAGNDEDYLLLLLNKIEENAPSSHKSYVREYYEHKKDLLSQPPSLETLF